MKKKVSKYLPEFVYGGIDGTVTTFAVVSGAVGASLSSSIILILGFANLFADGLSMAVSSYLSSKSDRELNKKKNYTKKPIRAATVTFLSFVFVGFIPLLFFVLSLFNSNLLSNAFLFSSILTGIAFLFVGSVKGFITKRYWVKSGLETLVIGAVVSLIAFLVGYFLRGLVN